MKRYIMGVLLVTGLLFLAVPLFAQNEASTWGRGAYGQLGNGSNSDSNVPVQVLNLTGVTAIAGGDYYSLALKNDGTVRAWGYNYYGQLGNGSYSDSNVPVQVLNLSEVSAIAGGFYHALALKNDGTVWAWGWNRDGQLGNGSNSDSNVPVQVLNLTGVSAIAGSVYHSLALKNDGTVWAFGRNNYGQLGNGSNSDSNIPVQVLNLTGVIAIAGGYHHSLALKNDGTVWAWGFNNYGQLGNGTTANKNTPVQVPNLSGVSAIAGGRDHSLALKNDETVRAWGYNYYGQLGNGSNSNLSGPVQVLNLTGVAAIAGGAYHSLALKNDGTVWAWGENYQGQLGNGGNSNSNVPVHVLNLTGVIAIAGGYGHSLAITGNTPSCSLTCTATVPSMGDENTAISFASTATSNPSGCTAPSFDWDFGDGISDSSQQNPTHNYTSAGIYNWTLIVSGTGASDCTKSGTITISPGGNCSLTCAATVPSIGSVSTPVDFIAAATPSNCIGAVSYYWSFGDGSTSTQQNSSHAFTSAGTYNWAMTASIENESCTQSGSIQIDTVTNPPVISSVVKLGSPFRLKVYGSEFHHDLQIFIGGDSNAWYPWKDKGQSLTVLMGGSSLKARFPKGVPVEIKIVNGDGGTATINYTR